MRAGRDLALRMRRSGAYAPDVAAVIDGVVREFGRGCETLASFMRQGGAGRPHQTGQVVAQALTADHLAAPRPGERGDPDMLPNPGRGPNRSISPRTATPRLTALPTDWTNSAPIASLSKI